MMTIRMPSSSNSLNRNLKSQVGGGGRECTLRTELTFLIWGVDVIAVAHHGPDGLSQTVPVGLFGSLIQQSVRHQARIASVLQILEKKKFSRVNK